MNEEIKFAYIGTKFGDMSLRTSSEFCGVELLVVAVQKVLCWLWSYALINKPSKRNPGGPASLAKSWDPRSC